jgi:AraC-like DNA-binding protein
MFSMRYFSPAPGLRAFLSSYYVLEVGAGEVHDIMRAELANVRFQLAGASRLSWPAGSVADGLPASLFGPRCMPLSLTLRGPSLIFGAGIMPLGWTAFFGVDSHELADTMLPLVDVAGPLAGQTWCRMMNATSDQDLVKAADALFTALLRAPADTRSGFAALVEHWLLSGGSVDDLVAAAELSSRQVERLCRRLYGAPPKQLHRKYRALKAAVDISINPGASWLDVAGPDYYDQSHFIREFRSFVGMTPSQFALNGAAVMSHSIRLRRQLPTLPRLSLVS